MTNHRFSLKGKKALVTGGAGLLGPVLAEALAGQGAAVIIADLNEKKAALVSNRIAKKTKKPVRFISFNATDERSVESMMKSAAGPNGRLDILVNALMHVDNQFYMPVEKYSYENWRSVMDVNLWAVFSCMQKAAPYLSRSDGASVINFGSIYGVVAPDQRIYGDSGINSPAVYAASKAGVIHLSKYMAVYWASKSIRVNSISPGGIWNNHQKSFLENYSRRSPQNRMLMSDDLSGAVIYLASNESRSVTGHNLIVDGGWTAW